jgi:DNA (cytosine-5)-methyltransferase 1
VGIERDTVFLIDAVQGLLFESPPSEHTNSTWISSILLALGVESGPGYPDRFGAAIHERLSKNNYTPIRTLSLFSGGGGLDIAFHDAGFDIVEVVEINEQYTQTLKANARLGKSLGNTKVLCVDIRDYAPDPRLAVDFIIGGPPCQTFSAAGRRAAGVMGTSDPRGTLFEEYVRVLKILKPKGFLFENVYGITGAQNGEPWQEIQDAFRNVWYRISYRVLDAADYGVPQHRERLFIVGLQDQAFLFPYPTHGPDSITPCPFFTAGEAVKGADVSDASATIKGRFGNLIPNIPPGLNYSFYTKEMGHPNPVFSWRSKFSDFMYKAAPDLPVRTIKAQGGQYTGPFSWENRHFTVAEMKRLQTIPDTYELIGKRQVCIEQIGNSVPPQSGRILALSILHQVMGVELPFRMHYMPESKELHFRKRKRILTELYAAKAKEAIKNIDISTLTNTALMPKLASDEALCYLSSSFALTKQKIPDSVPVKVHYNLHSAEWFLCVWRDNAGKTRDCYSIHITPSKGDWPLHQKRIVLCGRDFNGETLTTLWKAFEELVCQHYGIADLVQLFGYYQYSSGHCANFEFMDADEYSSEWLVIRQITNGIGVAIQMSAVDLSVLWKISESHIDSAMRYLRTIGYEIRNHNTNPQIPLDEYLVPYAFPTLTPRSVQLRKKF